MGGWRIEQQKEQDQFNIHITKINIRTDYGLAVYPALTQCSLTTVINRSIILKLCLKMKWEKEPSRLTFVYGEIKGKKDTLMLYFDTPNQQKKSKINLYNFDNALNHHAWKQHAWITPKIYELCE